MGGVWLRRCAVLLAAASLLSVVTGAAFTTNEERPLYFLGQIHLIAGLFTGVLTIGVTVALLFAEQRAWIRLLAWIASAIVIIEISLGFVALPQPPEIRFTHALLAQLLFAISVAIAVFRSQTRVSAIAGVRTSLRILAMITAILMLAQVALGVAFRHGVIDVGPHVLGAVVVTVFVAALAMLVLYRPENDPLRTAGVALLIVTGIQFFLGLTLYSIGLAAEFDPAAVIVVTMVHAALGASTLAATGVTALLVWACAPGDRKSHPSR